MTSEDRGSADAVRATPPDGTAADDGWCGILASASAREAVESARRASYEMPDESPHLRPRIAVRGRDAGPQPVAAPARRPDPVDAGAAEAVGSATAAPFRTLEPAASELQGRSPWRTAGRALLATIALAMVLGLIAGVGLTVLVPDPGSEDVAVATGPIDPPDALPAAPAETAAVSPTRATGEVDGARPAPAPSAGSTAEPLPTPRLAPSAKTGDAGLEALIATGADAEAALTGDAALEALIATGAGADAMPGDGRIGASSDADAALEALIAIRSDAAAPPRDPATDGSEGAVIDGDADVAPAPAAPAERAPEGSR